MPEISIEPSPRWRLGTWLLNDLMTAGLCTLGMPIGQHLRIAIRKGTLSNQARDRR
jgi:hypothetical protein